MESACETCAYFQTGPKFVPVLLRQRDHARDHNQPNRQALFDELLDRSTASAVVPHWHFGDVTPSGS
jgi:hypothetical protein